MYIFPWKHQKTRGFLRILWDIVKDQWYNRLAHSNFSMKKTPSPHDNFWFFSQHPNTYLDSLPFIYYLKHFFTRLYRNWRSQYKHSNVKISVTEYEKNTWKTYLTFSWRRPLSYRNQSIDLRSKSMDWFLFNNGLRQERVKKNHIMVAQYIKDPY